MSGFQGKRIAVANMPPNISGNIFAGYKVLPDMPGARIAVANNPENKRRVSANSV
jgi:hypothetical protein